MQTLCSNKERNIILLGESAMKELIKSNKIICILMNKQERIYYSNINKDDAKKCMEYNHVFNYLPVKSTVSYKFGHHSITINNINLDEEEYYLIHIQSHGNVYRYAYRDAFTGLYNRNYWEQLKLGMVNGFIPKEFTLIVIDVDNLKSINDNRGHLVGDKVIKIVGRAIKESIRENDIAIRYGGDEFFIFLASTKKAVVKKVIDRIKKNIVKKGEKEKIHIEISAGTACHKCLQDMEDIIKMADKNLYREKRAKKSKEGQNSEKLKYLLQEIEKLRDELNKKVTQEGKGINNEEALKLSQKLDELITRYLIDE